MSALTAIKGGLWLPLPPHGMSTLTIQSALLDGSGEKYAALIQVPKTGTLDSFEIGLRTVTTFPTNGVRMSFQNVSTTTDHRPDETQDQFADVVSSPGTNGWMVPPNAMTDDGTGGGVKRSVTAGDYLACVVEQVNSGDTWNLNVSMFDLDGSSRLAFGYPGSSHKAAGTWTANVDMPCIALKYDDGSYEFIAPWVYPMKAINAPTFASNSNPDERGLYFQFPMEVEVDGAWLSLDLDGDADLVLYDSDGSSELRTIVLDTNYRNGNGQKVWYARFAPVTLTAATNYRLVVRPTSVTQLGIYDIDVESAARLDCVEGGQVFHYTERTNAGAWTQTTTKRPWMGLHISKIHDGTGGGGTNIFNIME
jgi:hypothetical protein